MSTIRVLVVDDSAVVRRLVVNALDGDSGIEVVGTAANGELGLAQAARLSPDVITMDIEMPVLDGIGAVRALRARGDRTPVLMFSTLTERGAVATLDALAAGANDYVTKPSNAGHFDAAMDQVRGQLIPRIKALVPRQRPTPVAPAAGRGAGGAAGALQPRVPALSPALRPAAVRTSPYKVLAIGCSTGGPNALPVVLAALPQDLKVPVVVVQHMPPVFTTHFAARLDASLGLTVVEATDGQPLAAGTVYIAPGDFHLEVVSGAGGPRTRIQQGPAENFCRPAVDVLFRSVVGVYGRDTLAVVLTGMGSDGALGAGTVVAAGGSVLAQDKESSVVWGMPGAVAAAGLPEAVLPLPTLATTVRERLTTSPAVRDRAVRGTAAAVGSIGGRP